MNGIKHIYQLDSVYTTLISTAELLPHVHDRNWIVIDCRHDLKSPDAGQAAYQSGHILNAQFAHLENDLTDHQLGPQGEFRGRHALPTKESFCATLRLWGVNSDSQVIAYDAQDGMFAARLWWMLRWVGHESVAVLDGCFAEWTKQELPTSNESVTKSLGNFQQRPSLAATVDVDLVLAHLSSPSRPIIDARSPERFRGENETIDPRAGHIPGAMNRYYKDNVQANGHFKSAAQLREEFLSLSSAPAHTWIAQCGSGVTACHNLLAMEIAGLSGAALYPGSWSEWCSNPSRPIACG